MNLFMMNKNEFNNVKINVKNEAITGKMLNHNWEVVIDLSIGSHLPLWLILIWSQNIDKGYIIFKKTVRNENK